MAFERMSAKSVAARAGEWAFVLAATAVKLWLAASRRVEALGTAGYDDLWFIGRAANILEGRWLGEYDHLTLIKGPVFSMWIALTASQGIPLLFAQQLLYAVACVLLCVAVAPVVRSRVARCCLFVVVLFNPMTFADEVVTRVIREFFYSSLGLLVFACAAGAVLRTRRALPWAVGCGVAFALFWHTREESVWILPLLMFVVLGLVRRGRRAVMLVVVPSLIFVASHFALKAMNGRHYGMFATVEFKEESFLRAYGSLTHVRHARVPRIPVPREVRERVYAVSPAFAELRSTIEGRTGAMWRGEAADFRGEVFMWVFRQAVADAGYYERGGEAVRAYYNRLADEIDAARVEGRLDAQPARATLLPPIGEGQPRAVLRTFIEALIRTPRFQLWITPRRSQGRHDELQQFAAMTHSQLASTQHVIGNVRLIGWIVDVRGAVDIRVEHADGTPVRNARVTRLPSPDLYDHLARSWKEFPPARHARFNIDAPEEDAYLVFSLRGREIERHPLGSYPIDARHPNLRMDINHYLRTELRPAITRSEELRMRVMNVVARGYAVVFPPFLLLALLLYVVSVRRRGEWAMACLIAGLFAAVAGRVFILALIDVTSFGVFLPTYESPSHPLLLAGAMLCAIEGMVAIRTRLRAGTVSS